MSNQPVILYIKCNFWLDLYGAIPDITFHIFLTDDPPPNNNWKKSPLLSIIIYVYCPSHYRLDLLRVSTLSLLESWCHWVNSSLLTVLVNMVMMAVRADSWITHSSISKITEVSGGCILQVFLYASQTNWVINEPWGVGTCFLFKSSNACLNFFMQVFFWFCC